MDSRRETPQTSSTDGWKAVAWSCAALAGVALAGALALPPSHPSPYVVGDRADFWRPEWLVAATLVALPIFYAARRSCWLALPLLLLAAAQLLFVADSGVAVLREAGLAGGLDAVWYAVAGCQVVTCATAAAVGAARNIGYRRWVRQMRRMMPHADDDASVVKPPWPEWEEGFFSTG